MIASIGGLLILTYGLSHQDHMVFPVLFFIAKFGIASAFNVIFVGNTKIFPQEVGASTMSICSVLARLLSSL